MWTTQIIEQEKIDKDLMLTVQNMGISTETFQQQADMFSESLDGVKPYMSNSPKL